MTTSVYYCVILALLAGANPVFGLGQSVDQASASKETSQNPGQAQVAATPPVHPPTTPPPRHDEIVVTATRTPTNLGKIGQAVTTITSEELHAHGSRDILQVLETVPGFSVSRTGSFGADTAVFVRGGERNYNLVLIDGVPMNQPGGNFDFGDLTTANIERIEIVRGPASVLYGADAATSVIHIITRQGTDRASGKFGFEAGSYDTLLALGNVQGGTERLRYSTGLHFSQTNGFYDFNNRHEKIDFSGLAAFDVNSSSNFSSSFRVTDAEYQVPTDTTGAVVDPNDFRTTHQVLYSLSYRYLSSGPFTSKVNYGFSKKDSESFILEDGIEDFFDTTVETRENRHYLDWQNSLQLNPQHQLTGGISVAREASKTSNLSRRSLGLYLQEQFYWGSRFSLTAGARFDHNNRFDNFTTGTLSTSYLLDDQLKLRASLGNGVRAPSFDEIVGFPEFGILGNPNLQPERNLATDFGVDYFARDGKVNLSATVFFNRFSELVEFSFFVPAGTSNYINVEKARSRGLELEASWASSHRLRWGGQYTFTSTQVTDAGTVPGGAFGEGEALLRRPRHAGGLFGEYIRDRYAMRIDVHYKGSRDDLQFFPDFTSQRVVLPSYTRVDFAVTLPLIHYSDDGDMALVLRGENIFDRRYFEIAGFEAVGRGLWAGLEFGF